MNRTRTIVFLTMLFAILCFSFNDIQAQNQNGPLKDASQTTTRIENHVRQITKLSGNMMKLANKGNLNAAQNLGQQAMAKVDLLNQEAAQLLQLSFVLGSQELVMGASQISGLANALTTFNTDDPTATGAGQITILNQIDFVIDGCIRRELQDIGS